MKNDLNITTPLAMASRLSDAVSSLKSNSLQEYTAPTRLSPVVLIDKRVLAVDQGMVKALLQTMLSIYSAHYLQAMNITMNVGDVKVMRLLNQFGTDRDLLRSAGNSLWLGNESLDGTQLPTFGLEADSDSKRASAKPELDKTIMSINEDSNLAVGKIIEIKIHLDNHTTSIPVTATLLPKTIDPADLVTNIANTSKDKSFTGRYHAWRSGEITFIKDYLLTLDLIAADRKGLIADRTGHLLQARTKKTKGIFNTLVSGFGSPNSVSSMVIISKETAKELERTLQGKLSSHRVRNKLFDSISAMMIVVVDIVMERFTIYQRGISEPGMYTLEDIKNNDKRAGGSDIEAILAAYKLGDSPTL